MGAGIRVEEDLVYKPAAPDVEARQIADGVGPDTAAVLVRRDTLKTQAAAYRAKAGADLDLATLIDGIIAAAFDA